MDGGRERMGEIDLTEKREKTGFRSSCARLTYLGQDRNDIQYAVKMICQGMSKPTEGGKTKMNGAVRYLVGARRLVWKYLKKGDGKETLWIDVFVDSYWASDWERKSTTRGMIRVDGAGANHWARTQKARALSSGEAEYYAMVTGDFEGLGMQTHKILVGRSK